MRIAIDGRPLIDPAPTGKSTWTRGFVAELLRSDVHVTAFLPSLPEGNALTERCEVTVIPGRGFLWHLNVARALHRSSFDGFFFSPVSYLPPAIAPRSVRTITMVHDLIAFLDPDHERKARWIERWTLPRALRRTAHVCTASEATKRDLLERFPWVSPGSVTSIFAGPMRENPPANIPDSTTILCIATLCPRKNQLRLIQAYRALPERLRASTRVVLAGGRGWKDEEIVRLAQSTQGVQWLQYVEPPKYEELLRTCTVFALPSLYEGFGMQILDALQRGIPVLTSDRGSLKELCGDAAVIVNPQDGGSIAAGLESILTNEGLRRDLRVKGPERAGRYSWKRTVDLFLSAISHPL